MIKYASEKFMKNFEAYICLLLENKLLLIKNNVE